MKLEKLLLIGSGIAAALGIGMPATAQESPQQETSQEETQKKDEKFTPYFSLEGFIDTRERATSTIHAAANNIPGGIDFYGFIDFETKKEDEVSDGQRTAPYGEFKFTRKIWKGFGAAAEYNRNFASAQDFSRAGLMYSPDITGLTENVNVMVRFYPVATDEAGPQLLITGNATLGERVILDGFFDYNLKDGKIVTEPRARVMITSDLFFSTEFRYNGFRKDDFGVGIGLELKLR